MTSRFAPEPGGHDVVLLPVASGINVLEITVDGGRTAGRVRRVDRLVLLVRGAR